MLIVCDRSIVLYCIVLYCIVSYCIVCLLTVLAIQQKQYLLMSHSIKLYFEGIYDFLSSKSALFFPNRSVSFIYVFLLTM